MTEDNKFKKIKKDNRNIAVALGFEKEISDVPIVLASGRGKLAEQILEIAFQKGVNVREDADLAQMLSAIDIDSDIPVEAFAAVAEILSYIHEINPDEKEFINKNKE